MLIPRRWRSRARCRAGCRPSCRCCPPVLSLAPLPAPAPPPDSPPPPWRQRDRRQCERCAQAQSMATKWVFARRLITFSTVRSSVCLCLRGELTGSRFWRYDPWWADSPLRPIAPQVVPPPAFRGRKGRSAWTAAGVYVTSADGRAAGRQVPPTAVEAGRARRGAPGRRARGRSRRARRRPAPRCRRARHRRRRGLALGRAPRPRGCPAAARAGASAWRQTVWRLLARRCPRPGGLGLGAWGWRRTWMPPWRTWMRPWFWFPRSPAWPRRTHCRRPAARLACRSAGAGRVRGSELSRSVGRSSFISPQSSHAIRWGPSSVKQFECKLKRSGPVVRKEFQRNAENFTDRLRVAFERRSREAKTSDSAPVTSLTSKKIALYSRFTGGRAPWRLRSAF